MKLSIEATGPKSTATIRTYEMRGRHEGIWFRVGHWPGDLEEIAAHPCFELLRSLYMVLVWDARVEVIEHPAVGRLTIWVIDLPHLAGAVFWATGAYPGPLDVWSIKDHLEQEAPAMGARNIAEAHRPEGLP